MTLDEFIQEQHQALEAFRVWWQKNAVQDPEHFGMGDLAPGEWDEQFQLFDLEAEE